jgi:hypothetical protein
LVRATLAAYLPDRKTPAARLHNALEKRFAKVIFLKHFLKGDKVAAQRMGVDIGGLEMAISVVIAGWIGLQASCYRFARRVPLLRDRADAHLVRRIRKLLAMYGHAEFVTDATRYRPAQGTAPAAA